MATEEQVERFLPFWVLSVDAENVPQTCTLFALDARAPRALTLPQVKLSR